MRLQTSRHSALLLGIRRRDLRCMVQAKDPDTGRVLSQDEVLKAKQELDEMEHGLDPGQSPATT